MIIYKLTSPSGNVYIGKTKQDLEVRFQQHITLWKQLNEGDNLTYKLHHAFNKYPPETWKKEIILECDENNVDYHEIEQIKIHDSYKHGYNSTIGGDGTNGYISSEKHKQGISEGRKKWFQSEAGLKWKEVLRQKRIEYNNSRRGIPNCNKGKKIILSEESQKSKSKKLSKSLKGRIFSEEHRQNLSNSKIGKLHSAEHKKKISESQIGRKQTQRQKDIVKKVNSAWWSVTHPNGKVENIQNLNEFCKQYGLDQSNLCRGSHKKFKAVKLTEKGQELKNLEQI